MGGKLGSPSTCFDNNHDPHSTHTTPSLPLSIKSHYTPMCPIHRRTPLSHPNNLSLSMLSLPLLVPRQFLPITYPLLNLSKHIHSYHHFFFGPSCSLASSRFSAAMYARADAITMSVDVAVPE